MQRHLVVPVLQVQHSEDALLLLLLYEGVEQR